VGEQSKVQSTIQTNPTPADSKVQVTNLPQELYYNNPFDGSKSSGASFNTLSHDFTLTETTTFKIYILVENGYVDMDIYNKDNGKAIVDLDKLTSTSDTNTLEVEIVLEPGAYSVVLIADKFQGMYRVLRINE